MAIPFGDQVEVVLSNLYTKDKHRHRHGGGSRSKSCREGSLCHESSS